MRISIFRSIAANPQGSAQDAVLALSVLATGLLLAIEFDLFHFMDQLTRAERRVTLVEAIALTVLLALCIAVFVVRRYWEGRLAEDRHWEVEAEIHELREQALRDPLTDLPNRRAVLTRLRDPALAEEGRQHAFFLLDLDGFKQVNDRYGHVAGDQVLQVVADRFKGVARPTDLLARLGGDEFAVLAYDVDAADAAVIGQRYIGALENQIRLNGVGHKIGVSVGVVLVPRDCAAPDTVIANADIAMYRAKATAHSALVFFSDIGPEAGSSRA